MIRNSRRVAALAFAGAVAIAPVLSGCGAGQTPQTVEPTQLTEGVNVSLPKNDTRIDIRNMFVLGPKPGEQLPAGARVPLYASIINQTDQQDKLVSVSATGFSGVKIAGGGLTLPPRDPDGRGSLTNLLGSATQQVAAEPTKAGKKPKGTESPANGNAAAEPTSPGASPSGATGVGDSPTPNAGAPGAATPTPGTAGKEPLVVLTGSQSALIGGETLTVTLVFQNAGKVSAVVPVVPQQNEFAEYTAVSAGVPREGTPSATPGSGTPTTTMSPSGSPTPTQSGHNGGPGTPGANNTPPAGEGQ